MDSITLSNEEGRTLAEPPYLHPSVTASVRFLGFTVMIAVVWGCLSPLPVP